MFPLTHHCHFLSVFYTPPAQQQLKNSKLKNYVDEKSTVSILLGLSDTANSSSSSLPTLPGAPGSDEPSEVEIVDVSAVLQAAPLRRQRKRAGEAMSPAYEQDSARKRSSSMTEHVMPSTLVDGDDQSEDDSDDEGEGGKGGLSGPSGAAWKNTGDEQNMVLFRKERNRMHAKMTRDRKKIFASKLQQMISVLENENR